jgi:hypothetical protein
MSYRRPEIEGWVFRTLSCDATAEDAERTYREAVTRILAKYGRKPEEMRVRVEPFSVAGDPEIRFAVFIALAARHAAPAPCRTGK